MSKAVQKGTVKCICPGIGLSMPGTSHTGSYATGNVTALIPDGLWAKLAFCEKH